jgi:hypothetical protein
VLREQHFYAIRVASWAHLLIEEKGEGLRLSVLQMRTDDGGRMNAEYGQDVDVSLCCCGDWQTQGSREEWIVCRQVGGCCFEAETRGTRAHRHECVNLWLR